MSLRKMACRWAAKIGLLAAYAVVFVGSGVLNPTPLAQPSEKKQEKGTSAMQMTIRSDAFAAGKPIPLKYTGDGTNVSPPLSWSDVPQNTKELALIVDDPDAPSAEPWVHWVIYKIPADAKDLPEGIAPMAKVDKPAGAIQGKSSFGKIGYGGPYPPRGHGVHHYYFKLYALDTALALQAGADKKALLSAMSGHVVGQAETVGTYQR